MNTGKLSGLTVFITGASRGIGKAIALKVAKDGANVVVAAKTAQAHAKLPGTIYTTCEEVEKAGGKCLPCIVDVRDENQVKKAIEDATSKFGGIDILINNASAISLTDTEQTEMKRYDLMHNINTRGTFLTTKECLPFLKKSKHAHVLNLAPPLNMDIKWFQPHVAYTMAKYGMSMCVLGMHEEFRPYKIAVNALWPRTAIYTAAIDLIAGSEMKKVSRKPEIVADAAYIILSQDPGKTTGNFFVDEHLLYKHGVTDFDQYAVDPSQRNNLMVDFFLSEEQAKPALIYMPSSGTKPEETPAPAGATKAPTSVIEIFEVIKTHLSPELVKSVNAVFSFELTGTEPGKWFIDLKNGSGSVGQGEPPSPPDATLTMQSKHFFEMFTGKTKPATAYMLGRLKISGNLQKAMQLEKLLGKLKSKL